MISPKPRARGLWALLILLTILLLAWALRAVPFADILQVLGRLSILQIALLLGVNAGIVFLLGLRWWLILRAQGYALPYLAITRYRLAAFGVSYFTPGPHFGGEPLQVFLVRQRHGIPGSTAAAAIALDKMIELLSNFAFLAFGLALVLSRGVLGDFAFPALQWLAFAFLALPLAYLVALALGAKPLTSLAARLPERWARAAQSTEDQLAQLTRKRPALLAQTLLASIIVWGALLFEYWLALRFLGLALSSIQLLAVVVAARVAMLAPTPGALGALEAAQVFAMQSMGFDPALGLSLSLLIRGRDVLFGLAGLWLGSLARR